jgi:hypothetical protein
MSQKSLKNKIFPTIFILLSFLFIGWGYIGHQIINYNTILSALPEMEFFDTWADSLKAHASDADYRKSWDPNEAPKHYIDIDNYPEFIANGTIPQDFDSVVAIHGYSFVLDQGILPWAILNTADSLKTLFEMNDMHQAMLIAADLGHYIGDGHMPLHITRNYNGQYTNQNGVHSRYESTLIQNNQSQIVYDGDTLQYIDNLSDYVFNMLYDNYQYVDSVLYADSVAYAYANHNYNSTYYNKFWEIAKDFTIGLFKKASYRLTCVIYTEWVNAGGTTEVIAGQGIELPSGYNLYQNYPNPFNPSTTIKFSIPASPLNPSPYQGEGQRERSLVSLKVYDIQGTEIATLVNEELYPGEYEVQFNASTLPSGIYFYKLQASASKPGSGLSFSEIKKMVLLK